MASADHRSAPFPAFVDFRFFLRRAKKQVPRSMANVAGLILCSPTVDRFYFVTNYGDTPVNSLLLAMQGTKRPPTGAAWSTISARPDARASVPVVQDAPAMPTHVAMTAVQGRSPGLRSHSADDTAHDSPNGASHERSANGAGWGAFVCTRALTHRLHKRKVDLLVIFIELFAIDGGKA